MNLVIDLGNTCAKLAVFDNGTLVGEPVRTGNATLAALPDVLRQYPDIRHCAVSTVVAMTDETKEMLSLLPVKPLMLNVKTPLPISSVYRFPQGMGADRIASDVAAIMQCPDCPVMVFDAGTCLTCEMLHPTEGIIGGYISPGIRLRLISMHEHTSALPLYDDAVGEQPLLANDTEGAMKGGVVNGMAFEIEGYVRLYAQKYPDLQVFLTGGYSFSFDNWLKSRIIQDKYLLLRGLNNILEYNEP